MSSDYRRRLESTKRDNLGHVLLRSARLFDALGVAEFRERSGLHWLSSSHLRLIPHIDLEGTRVSDVALRMGITKQAVGQLAQPLIDAGLLDKIGDPEDGRARRLIFTPAGRDGILEGLGALAQVEARCRSELGVGKTKRLLADLQALLLVLETMSETPEDS